ncbi:glucosyl transferase, partial [Shigella flexneri]
LIASISLNFNLMYAPLIFNISAIIVRALLVSFILSGRFSYVNITPRIFTALFIIIMPEVSEVHANVTNDYWYLSLYLLLVMLAPKPTNNYQKAHDYIAIIICGLSGPFIVFMAPMVGINILIQKRLSTKK